MSAGNFALVKFAVLMDVYRRPVSTEYPACRLYGKTDELLGLLVFLCYFSMAQNITDWKLHVFISCKTQLCSGFVLFDDDARQERGTDNGDVIHIIKPPNVGSSFTWNPASREHAQNINERGAI